MSTPYVILSTKELVGNGLSHITIAYGTHEQTVLTVPTRVVGTPDADAMIVALLEARARVVDMLAVTED